MSSQQQRRALRVAFIDHCYGSPDPVLAALRLHFDASIDAAAPDVVFCGSEHQRERERFPGALKILLQTENRHPDFSEFHYAIGLRKLDHPRWFHQPLYVRTATPAQLTKGPGFVERALARKRKFGALVATNSNPVRVWRRLAMADALDARKRLDFGGAYRNNVGGPVPDKQEFLQPYRFTVAFENGGMRGHTTEKIADAMAADCLPVYWGNPDIGEEFNTRSFVNAHEYGSLEAVADRVMEIESSPALYEQYLAEPWFHDNRPNEHFDLSRLGGFLKNAIDSPRPALAPFYPQYRWHDWTRKLGFVADWALGKAGLARWRA